MRELYSKAGLPVPEFTETSGAFSVTFRKRRLTSAYLERFGLNLRQIAAVEHTLAHGGITNREYVKLTGVSSRTAADELHGVVVKGILAHVGAGRARQYRLQRHRYAMRDLLDSCGICARFTGFRSIPNTEAVQKVVCGGGIIFGDTEPGLIDGLARLLCEEIGVHEGGDGV